MTRPSKARLSMLGSLVRPIEVSSAKVPPKTRDQFYIEPAWKSLVLRLIALRGRVCERAGCGRTRVRLFGDHIVELADGGAPYDPANIQLLCGSCHTKKTFAARNARMEKVFGRFE